MRDIFGKASFAATQPWAPAKRQPQMGCLECEAIKKLAEIGNVNLSDADLACASCKKRKKKVWTLETEAPSMLAGPRWRPSLAQTGNGRKNNTVLWVALGLTAIGIAYLASRS